MQPLWRRAHSWPPSTLLFAVVLEFAGCASPGPPRPPSLQIPRLVSDLSAARSGDSIALHFSVPPRTTDGQPLRGPNLTGSLCRQLGDSGRCVPVDAGETRAPLAVPRTLPAPTVSWTDTLPAALCTGAPRLIGYRIELRNAAGRTAGFSDPVFAAGGAAPPPVAALRAEGMRLGVEIQWTPVAAAGEVLLERREPVAAASPDREVPPDQAAGHPQSGARASKPARSIPAGSSSRGTHRETKTPGLILLQAAPGDTSAAATIDTGIQEGVPYRYVALRRETVQLGGHTLELRSAPSAEVTVTWRDIYPPAMPTGLTALGYRVPDDTKTGAADTAGGYAVDLVWEPVEDTRLAGYLVYRQALNPAGSPTGAPTRLTAEPLLTPGFHDASAQPGARYRYSVSATDPRGNESAAAETAVEPAAP